MNATKKKAKSQEICNLEYLFTRKSKFSPVFKVFSFFIKLNTICVSTCWGKEIPVSLGQKELKAHSCQRMHL